MIVDDEICERVTRATQVSQAHVLLLSCKSRNHSVMFWKLKFWLLFFSSYCIAQKKQRNSNVRKVNIQYIYLHL
jgi:hypothetical protein